MDVVDIQTKNGLFRELLGKDPSQISGDEMNEIEGRVFALTANVFQALCDANEPVLTQDSKDYADGTYRTSTLTPAGVPFVSDITSEDAMITIRKVVVEKDPVSDDVDWSDEPEYSIEVVDGDETYQIAFVGFLRHGGYESSLYDTTASSEITRDLYEKWEVQCGQVLNAILEDVKK